MCLGEVAAVRAIGEGETLTVEAEGRVLTVSSLTLDDPVVPGDWVLVHAGFALSRLDPVGAADALAIRNRPRQAPERGRPHPRRGTNGPAPGAQRRYPSSMPGTDGDGRAAEGEDGVPMHTTVANVMSGSVVAVRPAAGFKEIVTLMRQHQVSAVPVVDPEHHVIGIVSEADLLLKEVPADAASTASILATGRRGERARAAAATAADLMTSSVATIRHDAPVTEAARLMHDQGVKRLPVVDRDGKLTGIVSRIDVLSVFDRPDEQIRDEISTNVIAGEFGLDPAAVEVTVSSGIVTVSGPVNRRETAMQLLEAIRRSDGVVDVRDRLEYPQGDQPHAAAGSLKNGGTR